MSDHLAAMGLTSYVGVTIFSATQVSLSPKLAKILGDGLAFLINFPINLLIVFR